ncbi:hypothetical protein PO909_013141 [Leuciscus waleckii]
MLVHVLLGLKGQTQHLHSSHSDASHCFQFCQSSELCFFFIYYYYYYYLLEFTSKKCVTQFYKQNSEECILD